MNGKQVMQFNGNDVTFLKIENDYWTPAIDVARAIGYENPSRVVSDTLRNNNKRFEGRMLTTKLSYAGQIRDITVLNKKGMVTFTMLSKHENALNFQIWADDKLEELMSKGVATLESKPMPTNSLALADMMEQAALTIRAQANTITELEYEIDTKQPYVDAHMDYIQSDTKLSVKDAADLLAFKGIGQNNLFKFMRQLNMITFDNSPYRDHVDAGHLCKVECGFKPDGEMGYKTVVLPKGVDYIRKKLMDSGFHQIAPTII